MRALASWSTSFRQASSARCVLHEVREVFYLGHVFAFDQPFLHIFIIHFFDARFLSIRSSVKLPAGRELKCSKKYVFLNELLCKISLQTSKQTNNILPPLRFSGLSLSSVHKHVFRSLFFKVYFVFNESACPHSFFRPSIQSASYIFFYPSGLGILLKQVCTDSVMTAQSIRPPLTPLVFGWGGC